MWLVTAIYISFISGVSCCGVVSPPSRYYVRNSLSCCWLRRPLEKIRHFTYSAFVSGSRPQWLITLAACVCFYSECLHHINVLPWKTDIRVGEMKAPRWRGSTLPRMPACTQAGMGKQWTAWLHKQNKDFEMPKTPFLSSVLSFHHYHYHSLSHDLTPLRHTHKYTHAVFRKLLVFVFTSFHYLTGSFLHFVVWGSDDNCQHCLV